MSAVIAGCGRKSGGPPTELPAPSLIGPANAAQFTPGRPVTFDWSDVTGAAGYTIQIDDSNTFSAPLTLQPTVAGSVFTTSTLPKGKLWWRGRAVDNGGTAGAWSATRRVLIRK